MKEIRDALYLRYSQKIDPYQNYRLSLARNRQGESKLKRLEVKD